MSLCRTSTSSPPFGSLAIGQEGHFRSPRERAERSGQASRREVSRVRCVGPLWAPLRKGVTAARAALQGAPRTSPGSFAREGQAVSLEPDKTEKVFWVSEAADDERDTLEEVAASHLHLARFLAHRLPPTERLAARRLLDDLAAAHRKTPVLARGLLLAQHKVNDAEQAAEETFDAAAQAPGDERAADCALAMALASEQARQSEREATELWFRHRLHVSKMLDEAATMLGAKADSPEGAASGFPREPPDL